MRFILLLYLVQLYSCKCASHEESTYYGNARIRTTTEKDCNNNLLRFASYQFDSTCDVFELYYDKGRPDTMCGRPWTHVIWNKEEYYVGDTVELIIDVAEPPLLESEFNITDNDGNTEFAIMNSYNFKWTRNGKNEEFLVPGRYYKYQTIVNDTFEEIKLKNTYRYLDKSWATVTRSQKIKVIMN